MTSPQRPPASEYALKKRKLRLSFAGGNLMPGASHTPEEETSSTQTLKVAGGPDATTLRRFDLWREGTLCDVSIKCSGRHVVKSNRLELAVWSDYFRVLFSQGFKDSNSASVNLEDADANVLESLVRAMYEREITLTPVSAMPMLQLCDLLQVPDVREVVEHYLETQLRPDNAVQTLLLADQHSCKGLQRAAIPLTAAHFDKIDTKELCLLGFEDIKALLSNDRLAIVEEVELFKVVKGWMTGPSASKDRKEAQRQLEALVKEIRMEHIPSAQLAAMLEMSWVKENNVILAAIARAGHIKPDPYSPRLRKVRNGQVVEFKNWSEQVARARKLAAQDSKLDNKLYSETFHLPIRISGDKDWHLQVYPLGFPNTPDQVGVFLALADVHAIPQAFRISIVNRANRAKSVFKDCHHARASTGGSLRFWGSQTFVALSELTVESGLIHEDTLTISVLPLAYSMIHSTPKAPGAPAAPIIS